MKILIAEDDLIAAKYLTVTLQKLGHEVMVARDGETALREFTACPPPVVISDWMMPGMNGLELCQSIRKLGLDEYTYFILQTAKNTREDNRTAMQAGIDDFLTKPVNAEELGMRLRVAERIISQRREAEHKIRALARFPSDNPNPVLQVDRNGRILYANTASLGLLTQWRSNVGDLLPAQLQNLIALLVETGERQEVEVNCADAVFSVSATSLSDDGVVYLYGHDITERKKAENELVVLKNQAEESAVHDQLTGLPNRRLLTERLVCEAARAARQGTKLALVMLDLDNFKQINDGFGHEVGDRVLVSVSRCLSSTLRATDTICRWGGDELVLLLTDLKERSQVGVICQKIVAAVKQAAATDGLSAPITLSMGSAILPDDADEPTLLMQQADYALYTAKADGRDCWREFKGFPPGYDARNRADLFIRLSAAIAEGRISTFYQPIIDTRTWDIVGAETLARWNDDKYGWVSPDVFIPLAEEKGLILKLGDLVLRQACDQLVEWQRAGLKLDVSVNLSKRQLFDPELGARILGLLQERNLQPSSVILEVTERQSVLGQAFGRQRMDELAAAGFRLSIDDFGSGYSSFDLVGEASFSELKINIGLVRRSNTLRGRRIVQAIVEMGRTLGFRVVAEGIEDQVTQAMLAAIGVDKLQGYLFSKPLQAGAFLGFVEKYQARQARRRAA